MKESSARRKVAGPDSARRVPAFVAPASWFGLGLLAALPATLLLSLLGSSAPAAPGGPPPPAAVRAAIEESCRTADGLAAEERYSDATQMLRVLRFQQSESTIPEFRTAKIAKLLREALAASGVPQVIPAAGRIQAGVPAAVVGKSGAAFGTISLSNECKPTVCNLPGRTV